MRRYSISKITNWRSFGYAPAFALLLCWTSCQSDIGCTDPQASNFDPNALEDDGSCTFIACEPPLFNGHTYSVVAIGNQCWFAENLVTEFFANGDTLDLLVGDDWEEAEMTEIGAYDFYGFQTVFFGGWADCIESAPDFNPCEDINTAVDSYGLLYNWHAVNDPRGLCPSGWHVPSSDEWEQLFDYVTDVGFPGGAAVALKSNSGWASWAGESGDGNNELGFNALPGGYKEYNGDYAGAGKYAFWWSSSEADESFAFEASIDYNGEAPMTDHYYKERGYSIRCLKNN